MSASGDGDDGGAGIRLASIGPIGRRHLEGADGAFASAQQVPGHGSGHND